MTDRLNRTLAELKAAEEAARAGDVFNTLRDLDCAFAEGTANQKLDTTESNWVARNREQGKRWACIFCALLTIGANLLWWAKPTRDHCADAGAV